MGGSRGLAGRGTAWVPRRYMGALHVAGPATRLAAGPARARCWRATGRRRAGQRVGQRGGGAGWSMNDGRFSQRAAPGFGSPVLARLTRLVMAITLLWGPATGSRRARGSDGNGLTAGSQRARRRGGRWVCGWYDVTKPAPAAAWVSWAPRNPVVARAPPATTAR